MLNQQKHYLRRKNKSKWITEEISELKQERQKITKGSSEHRMQVKRIHKKCGEVKEERLNKNTKKLRNQNTQVQKACIRRLKH